MAEKSVIEKKYEKRRPEDDAISPDTTLEELVLGPGRLAVGGARALLARRAAQGIPTASARATGAALEGGAGGGAGASRLPSWLQEPGRFGPTTLRPSLNRPAQAGYSYRSPVQTNANSLIPHPLEDVIASQRADIGRMVRGVTTPAASERGQAMQRAAGLRGLSRTGTRVGIGALAVEEGNRLREKNEKMSAADKRKLAAAKADMEAAESRDYPEMDTSGANPDAVRGEQYGRGAPDGMKRGGRVKKMVSGGMTSKASGASKRADGIAQRGKTKGRMC